MNGYNKDGNMKKSSNNQIYIETSNVVVPDEVDWRTKGYVTPV